MAGDINRVTLVGRLTRDPELRHLPSGVPVLQLGSPSTAGRRTTADNWVDKPNFFDVKVFGNQAEMLSNHLAKGRRVGVDGRLDWSSWEAQDGSKRSKVEIVANTIQFLDSRQDAEGGGQREYVPPRATSRPTVLTSAPPAPTTTFRSKREPMARRPENRWHSKRRETAAPARGRRAAAEEELLLLQGEDRRGRLQELQPTAALRLREGEDPVTADHGRMPAASGAGATAVKRAREMALLPYVTG